MYLLRYDHFSIFSCAQKNVFGKEETAVLKQRWKIFLTNLPKLPSFVVLYV